jgi:3'-phosphoadenosine 5'-phosphosulfate sulfotransferase (PAPS reductase)/FAD synthetase
MNAITPIKKLTPDIEIFDALAQTEQISLHEVVNDFHQGVHDLRQLIETGAILHCPTSMGKDSTVVSLLALEAYRQAIAEGTVEKTRPLILSTVDTGAEALPMKMYVRYAKKRVDAYAKACGIEGFRYDIVQPPINDQFFLKYVGAQKLIPNASRHGDCSIILKVDPSERHVKRLMQELSHDGQYAGAKVITCVGSRISESSRRSQNMSRQGIAAKDIDNVLSELEESSLGGYALYKFAPIRNWATERVFDALRLAGSKPLQKLANSKGIPSFLTNHGLLLEIYGNGSAETCAISIGSNNSSGCNGKARFGCVSCTMVGTTDHSSTAIAKYERWRVLGAESALRVRDYMFRLSTQMEARAMHARAFDPVGFNRVALQPNTLRPRHLEKLVRFASQLTVDSIRAAAEFKALVGSGREMEHAGYREIAEDPFMPPKTKIAFLDMYKECAVDPTCLNELFSLEHALLLSFRWSLDGVGGAMYRPLAIWLEISEGKGWIPYPKLNSELQTPVTLQSEPLPEAVMMPVLKQEDAKPFALEPFNLLSLWRRPADISDMFDADRNCTITRQADYLANIDVSYLQRVELQPIALDEVCSAFDVVVETETGEQAVRVVPAPAEILSVKLEGKVIRGSVAKQLIDSGLQDEITEQLKAKIYAIQYLKADAADITSAVMEVLAPVTGEQRIQRKVKHLRKDTLFAGYSDTSRNAPAPMSFTKRVTKIKGNRISRGNTRMTFYAPQVDSRLHLAHKQEISLLVPDFSSHTEKFIGTHDAALLANDTEALENILVSQERLAKWIAFGGMTRAKEQHDQYLRNTIQKRHLRGFKASSVRQYAGTHVAEHLLAEGVISIEKTYWAQLRAILKRTHIFNEMGLFMFQSMSVADVQAHPKAIAMAQHRADKAQILAHVRAHRNAQRRNVKAGDLTDVVAQNLSHFKTAAIDAISAMTHEYFSDAFKLRFNTSEVASRTKADVSSLWLSITLDGVDSLNDVLSTVMPPAQLATLKTEPKSYMEASKACAAVVAEIRDSIHSALSAWSPLVTATHEIQSATGVDSNAVESFKDAALCLSPEFWRTDELMKYWKPSQVGFEKYLAGTVPVMNQYMEQLGTLAKALNGLAAKGVRGISAKMSLRDKLALLNI